MQVVGGKGKKTVTDVYDIYAV